jgi:PEP-CTERM motif
MGLASPALAAIPLHQQTGPDLTTKIYSSGDSGISSTGPTVYGNTSTGAGHDVQFTGYSSFSVGTNSGTTTNIQVSSPTSNGFAQISDATFDQANTNNQDDLFYLVMNPDPAFYMYEFSIQTLAGGQDINVWYWLTGGSMWILSTGSPLQNGNGDTQYIFGDPSDPSVSVDKILITSASPIQHVKQNSIQLTGTVPSVPEPGTWGLMLLGFAGVGVAMRRSRKNRLGLMQIA